MNNDILVSVIMPSYNSEKYIGEAIESVINQTNGNWELLITDDCSTDNTLNIINEYADKDKRIRIFSLLKNSGSGIARNNSIKNARGKYIAFLDSDDIWHSKKLEIQLKFMKENNNNFSFTNYNLIVGEKKEPFNSLLEYVGYKDIIRFNYIACSTVIYDQDILGKNFMPNIRNRQDWGLWINLIKKNGEAICIPSHLMNYRIRKDSISSNKLKMIKYHWYIYKKHLGFSYTKTIYYLGVNIIMHLKNKRK